MMPFALAIVIASYIGSVALSLIAMRLIHGIKGSAFVGQVQKLMADDRAKSAIKLCDAAPNSPLAITCRAMVARHRRPYSLELEYQTGLLCLRTLGQTAHRRFLGASLGVWAMATLVLLQPDHGAAVPLSVAAGLWLVAAAAWRLTCQGLAANEVSLAAIRTVLLGNAGYAPPVAKPRKFTQAELDAWRVNLGRFEDGFAEAAREEDLDAADEYDARADADGVLPAL